MVLYMLGRREFLEVSAAFLGSPFILKVPSFLEDERVITHGNRDKPQVALTFDDGFLPQHVEKIAEVAARYGLKFTFFPVGWRVLDRNPQLWRDIFLQGHEIENHSHSHRILRSDRVKPEEMVYDIALHNQLLDEILGQHYEERFFRPPGGYLEQAVVDAAESLGLSVVTWSLDSGGTSRKATPDSAFARVARAWNGDIVLLHCINNDTARLPAMIETLQDKGLELVTLSKSLEVE